eukprot:scaffold12362_cov124-Isochrysis_galbana.AAC.1
MCGSVGALASRILRHFLFDTSHTSHLVYTVYSTTRARLGLGRLGLGRPFSSAPVETSAAPELCALRSVLNLSPLPSASSARLRLLSPDPDPGRWTPAPEPGAGELGAAGGQTELRSRRQNTEYRLLYIYIARIWIQRRAAATGALPLRAAAARRACARARIAPCVQAWRRMCDRPGAATATPACSSAAPAHLERASEREARE